jgi:hypothetical protein
MFRRAAALLCAFALALIGCSSDSKPTAQTNPLSSAQPTTTPVTTPPTTIPLTPAATPAEAATSFVNAWRDGDRALASSIARPPAVDAVFAAGEPGSLQNRGCNSPPPNSPVLCVYKTAVGELQVRLVPEADGWIVDQAKVSADG